MINSELSKFLVMLKNCQLFSSKKVRTLVLDDSIDSSALTCAITGTDSSKKRQLSKIFIENAGPTSNFLITIATSQLENPVESVELQFEFADSEVAEMFIETFCTTSKWTVFPTKKKWPSRWWAVYHNVFLRFDATTDRINRTSKITNPRCHNTKL